MSRQRIGVPILIAGGLGYEASLSLLPFVRYGSATLWETALTTRLPLILTLICGAAIALAAVSLITDVLAPPLLATCLSFWLLGLTFPVGAHAYRAFGVGFWLAASMAAVMSLSGLLALTGMSFATSRSRRTT